VGVACVIPFAPYKVLNRSKVGIKVINNDPIEIRFKKLIKDFDKDGFLVYKFFCDIQGLLVKEKVFDNYSMCPKINLKSIITFNKNVVQFLGVQLYHKFKN